MCPVRGGQDSQTHWLLQCPHNGGEKWRKNAHTELALIESHNDSSPVLRWTARYIDSQLLHIENGRRVWTANWTGEMIEEYSAGILDPFEVREVAKAVLRCSKILTNHMSELFEERKIFLASHEYVALCMVHPNNRNHDYELQLEKK